MTYPSQYPHRPAKKRRMWPWFFAAPIVGFVVVAAVFGVAGENPPESTGSDRAAQDRDAEPPAPAAPEESADPVVEEEPPPPGPAAEMSTGTYQVGVDVAPGRYKTPGPGSADIMDMCYWARHSDDSGSFESILANGNLQGPGSVTVNKGEFVELMGACVWKKVG